MSPQQSNWREGFRDRTLKIVGQNLIVPRRFFPYVAYNLRGVGYLEDPIKLPEDEVRYRMEKEYFLKANINERALVGIGLLKRAYHEDEVFLNCVAAFLQEGSWIDFRVTGWPRMKKKHLKVRYLVEKGVLCYLREDAREPVQVSPRANGVTPTMMPFYHWWRAAPSPRIRQEAHKARHDATQAIPLTYDLQGESLPAFI